jgi:AI-2 transport protein TqsA
MDEKQVEGDGEADVSSAKQDESVCNEEASVLKQSGINPLVSLAAVVIIIAGLITAKTIVIPILLAIFITILLSPLLIWLQQKGLNNTFSLIGVVLILIIGMTLFGFLVSNALNDFAFNLPVYESKLKSLVQDLIVFMHEQGIEFSEKMISGLIDPTKIAQFASGIAKGMGAALTNGLMILLLVIFMLLEASILPKKLLAIHADASLHAKEFLNNVKQYMMIKSVFSAITGLLVYIALLIIGLDYALLWGVLAFLLNFVPNIGSIIAAVPTVLVALIQFGFIVAIEVSAVFVLINIIIGSVLEPKYMGQGLGLSTLVVFVSLIFWGWVFGPVGMLLSIPLTIMLKLALQSNPQTKWIAILLDSEVKE